jgi:hypothetical protein
MRYRALFIGGVLDGQEKVLDACPPRIDVMQPAYMIGPSVARGRIWCYVLVLVTGATIVYSTGNIAETLDRLWHQYTGGRYA